jgi:hypothetical protein
MSEERTQVLEMLQAGKISAEEAMQLLDALNGVGQASDVVEEDAPEAPSADVPNVGSLWLYPTIAGAVVMAVGAPLMALGLTGQAAVFWSLLCGWIPFFIGLAILTLGVWSRTARWFHLRITNEHSGKRTFVLGLPLPLTLAAWVLKMVRPFVPQLRETGVDEAILSLRDGLGSKGNDEPFIIDVHDDDEGEHVQIYIGLQGS